MVEFGTAGIRGSVVETVTPHVALSVGSAVGRLAVADAPTEHPEIVIGRDGRLTGPALAAAVEAGVAAVGALPVRVGTVPTPTLAFASRGRYGVMLTASHNPPADNGIKCFVDGEEFGDELEARIEALVDDAAASPAEFGAWGSPRRREPLPDYRTAVTGYVRDQLPRDGESAIDDGLRVAVDCGNGMAALATPQVLDALGATTVALNANVDGRFPGRPSKPTPETLGDLQAFVVDGDFDLGIAHDGDADRIVILDSDGEIVHEDSVVAMLAGYYTRRAVSDDGDPDDADDAAADRGDDPVVVTTPNASGRIDEQVTAAGGRVERVRLGALHEGIAAAERDGGSVVFAAEPWKHIHPGFGGWIDGVVSAALLTGLVATRGLAALREPITERPYRKVSIDCPDGFKAAAMTTLESSLPDAFSEATVSVEHGVRLSLPDGSWLLVRPSGTEPYIRLYAESESVDEIVDTATERIAAAIADADGGAD
ncbi:phosphomannomutase [Halonotius aquaticus]|uniref:Phosphomannomutase n=1 Tax=Halonotius aquaticus TaxID=2216978 RepID=A0A3A6PQP8_9EURY|nr:phosphomannomutase [Halonotius aquaticus]RJX43992.1 phosphomannomutase [Halonotius aquaticus]